MNDYDDFVRKGAFAMKMKPVLLESLRLYRKNFPQLCLSLLVQLVLRALCLIPLMFRADAALAPLAWLCVPLYLLIVLPARQNYALALQDMMAGGSVFSPRLISVDGYGKKLLRGLKGTLCILLWSTLTITGVTLLAMYYTGAGGVDGLTFLRWFESIGGGSITDGIIRTIAAVVATGLLIVVGCAVHSGARHAHALGDKQLLRGNRLRLTALWFVGLVTVLPFAAAIAAIAGDWALGLLSSIKAGKNLVFDLSGGQIASMAAAVVLLLLPLLPLKNLLPAVYLRLVKESKKDAQA